MELPKTTKKQQEILSLIYLYRFLNSTQIQTFLNHTNKSKINIWLSDLMKKNYLNQIHKKDFNQNHTPTTYYLSGNGIRFISDLPGTEHLNLAKYYREILRTEDFIQRRTFLADIVLSLSIQNTDKVTYRAYLPSELAKEEPNLNVFARLNPDLILIRFEQKRNELYLLELISSTLPLSSFKKRLTDYGAFIETTVLTDKTDGLRLNTLTLLLVCADKLQMIRSKRYLKRIEQNAPLPQNITVWLTYQGAIKEKGLTGRIWEEVRPASG